MNDHAKFLRASGKFLNWPEADSGVRFKKAAGKWDHWIQSRVSEVKWLDPSLVSALRARSIGLYEFTKQSSKSLQQFATSLGILYEEIGPQIQKQIEAGETWPFGDVGPDAQQVLKQMVKVPHSWARTLRADIVLDPATGKITIVEVNSDNVGGIEDLLLQLSFAMHARAPVNSDLLAACRNRILRNLKDWITTNSSIHQAALKKKKRNLPDLEIAILCQDLEISALLSHYLSEELQRLGLRVTWARPENLEYRPEGVSVKKGGKRSGVIDLVLRDWLFKEMFEEDDVGKPLRPVFKPFLQAITDGQILVLNPIRERLLFSKAILAHAQDPTKIVLSPQSLRFAQEHFAPTAVVSAPEFEASIGKVFKPVAESGGCGVIFNAVPDSEDWHRLRGGSWVTQPALPCERHMKWLRQYDGESFHDSLQKLYVVHGVVVHGFLPGQFRLTGVLTRGGPEPVVNWSRGAQIFAALV